MCWIREDFGGRCLNDARIVESVAARFASSSAFSLPAMSMWPGIQVTFIYISMSISASLFIKNKFDPNVLR